MPVASGSGWVVELLFRNVYAGRLLISLYDCHFMIMVEGLAIMDGFV